MVEPESIRNGNGPAPSMHTLTNAASPWAMRTIRTDKTDGLVSAGRARAHPADPVRGGDAMGFDAVDFWLATAKDGTAVLVPKANATTADMTRLNRSTERVCTEEGARRRFRNPRSRPPQFRRSVVV